MNAARRHIVPRFPQACPVNAEVDVYDVVMETGCVGRGTYNNNDKFGAPENGQVIEGGRFGRNTGQRQGGGNFRENFSGGGNVDVVETHTKP